MTSFLNKKFSLILVILATLIIATSISGVSAAAQAGTDFDIALTYDDGNTTKTVVWGDKVNVNLTVTSITVATGQGLFLDGNLTFYYDDGTPTAFKQIEVNTSGQNWGQGTSKNWTATLNTSDIPSFGTGYTIYVEFKATNPGSASLEEADDFDSSLLMPAVEVDLDILTKSRLFNTTTEPTDLKIGQDGNFIGYLQYFDPATNNWTACNGTLNYTFNGVAGTINATAGFFNITLGAIQQFTNKLEIRYDGSAAYHQNLSENFTLSAVKGKLEAFVDWNSSVGYYLGENSTVHWNLNTTGFNFTGKSILAWIILTNPNDNTEWRKIMVNINESTGKIDLSQFIRTHDVLRVALWINGLDLVSLTQFFESGEAGYADTFVYTNNSIPVRVNMTVVEPLQVGKEGIIIFNVTSVLPNITGPVNGVVELTFDGKWSFNVTIENNSAIFTHLFTLAGDNRLISAKFLGNPDQSLSATQKAVSKTVNVTKGNATLVLAQLPNHAAAFVGQVNTFEVLITNFAAAAASAPKNVTLIFRSGGKTVHQLVVDIVPTPGVATNATATINYAYKMTHSPVTVTANLVDPKGNYRNSTSQLVNVVVVA